MNSKENIFIHNLKTGGTTINTAMNSTDWQTEVDFYYRHIQKKTKRSNCADIFDPKNFEKYSQYNIFTMVRHPVDRLISEYYFIKEREGYFKLLTKKPESFEEYIENPQTHNFMTGFLLGKRMYDTTPTTPEHLNQVLNAIGTLPIYVGIFEKYAESLNYFTDKTGIIWPETIEAKRMTFQRPKTEEITTEIKNKILENNYLDLELYDHCLGLFNNKKVSSKKKFDFKLSKYDHIIPYSKTMILYSFCVTNKNYLKQNNLFFRKLNTFLHANLKITNGYEFAASWNASFVEAVSQKFPNSEFSNVIREANESDQDCLQQTINIGKAIDNFFEQNSASRDKFYKSLDFSPIIVRRARIVTPEKKENQIQRFISKLFSK